MKLILALFAAVAVLASTTDAADDYPLKVPLLISVCYENQTISNRVNRLPLSMDNLIALVRKVEQHPATALWTVAKMTGTLLRRFRYDGIIDNPVVGPGLVPITRDTVETDKFSLQWYLFPGHSNDFPEDALTQEEKCSMHWMLSYSLNNTQRAEEKVVVRQGPGARSLDLGDQDEMAVIDNSHEHDGHHQQEEEGHAAEPTDDVVESASANKSSEERTEERQEQADELGEHSGEHDEEDVFRRRRESLSNSGSEFENSSEEEDDSLIIRILRDTLNPTAAAVQSKTPLEIGVVRTSYGTVAAGLVLAGLATGRDPQRIQLKDLIKDPSLQITAASLERYVESPWVATLAGDVAQSALLKASQGVASVGPRGKWNNTYCPRESAQQIADHSLMTIAEMYGGIDGLLISKRINTWDNSYMKLSHVLEMYYSDQGVYGDATYRACSRLANFKDPNKVDMAMLKEQALSAALIYYSKGMVGSPSIGSSYRPVDIIGGYVNNTVNEMMNYINANSQVELDFVQCQGLPEVPLLETAATYSDLTFVVDQFNDPTDIDKQKELMGTLATYLDIQPGGSRMEVISSKDGTPFFNLTTSSNRAEIACRIQNLNIPYSERRIADVLARMRSRIAQERALDRLNKINGANSRAILFFVSSYTAGTSESNRIRDELAKYQKEMPDVNVMFATLASAEEFRSFVKKFDRDIIRMNTFVRYADAAPTIAASLATVPARFFYPACKDTSASSVATEASFVYTGFLNPQTVQYFRIGAENFFSSQSVTIRMKSTYGVAKFCWSNTNERPGIKDTCSNVLKPDETVEFKFVQPCARLPDPASCPAIYISATPLNNEDGIPCSEKSCHTPDQVKFTFTHQGMRCSSAAANVFISYVAVLSSLLLASWSSLFRPV